MVLKQSKLGVVQSAARQALEHFSEGNRLTKTTWHWLIMKFKIMLGFALVLSGGIWTAQADEPGPIPRTAESSVQLEAQQNELCALLVKAGRNSSRSNEKARVRSQPGDFSPNLTEPENARLLKLLCDPKVAERMPLELALAALRQREAEESLPGGQYNALMDVVNRRWPHDPVVIAFFREALAVRGPAAIFELWSPQPGIWDDSLLEPVVRLAEKTAEDSAPSRWIVTCTVLEVLDLHYSVWATNASIPPRLSKAVLMLFPSLTNAIQPSPKPGDQIWCNAVGMLAKTHDAGMIAVIRPFLKDEIVAGDGALWIPQGSGLQPLRACDEAAIAIRKLLDDLDSADGGYAMSGGFVAKPGASYPKWREWDKKIGELQKRLDALPQK
jgi:hypothetical protein